MNKTGVCYETMEIKSALNRVAASSMPFRWSLNPYRGCRHGCSFCYARSTHAFLGVDADDTFQNRIFIKKGAEKALEQQIRKMLKNGGDTGEIAIGTATDPYQPVEAREKLTRKCVEVLVEYGLPFSITTRSPLVLRDLDLLRKANLVSVNISINTVNPKVWRNMEPFSPSPSKRLETIQTLSREGIPVTAFIAPVLPFLTDGEEDLDPFISSLAASSPRNVMVSVLRLSQPEVKVWFFETLAAVYPQYVSRYASLYQHSAHPPSSYRREVTARIDRILKRYGLGKIGSGASKPSSTANKEPEQLAFSFS